MFTGGKECIGRLKSVYRSTVVCVEVWGSEEHERMYSLLHECVWGGEKTCGHTSAHMSHRHHTLIAASSYTPYTICRQ